MMLVNNRTLMYGAAFRRHGFSVMYGFVLVHRRAMMDGAALMHYRFVMGWTTFMHGLCFIGRTCFMRGLSFLKRSVFMSRGFYLMGRAVFMCVRFYLVGRTAFIGGSTMISGCAFLNRPDLLMLRRAFTSVVSMGRRRFGDAHYKGSA